MRVDGILQVNNNSARPSVSSPPVPATDAGRARRSQSASVDNDDDYLVPKQNYAQPTYLDFPDAEPGRPNAVSCYWDGN